VPKTGNLWGSSSTGILFRCGLFLQNFLESRRFLYYKSTFKVPAGMNNDAKYCSQDGRGTPCRQRTGKMGKLEGRSAAATLISAVLLSAVVFIFSPATTATLL
jgi:hypothetical protein